jgi:hypothetical protein
VDKPVVAAPLDELRQRVAEALQPENYRDLNNANNQAPGATRMMIRRMAEFSDAVAAMAAAGPDVANAGWAQLIASPYPFAHFLALQECARGRMSDGSELTGLLERCVQSSDTVKFYWTCEAIADRRITSAVPVLVRLAQAENPPGLHGPAGMGHGYPAARAVGRLAGNIDHEQVQPLLHSDNIWIRAGVLAGLAEARASGIEPLLKDAMNY